MCLAPCHMSLSFRYSSRSWKCTSGHPDYRQMFLLSRDADFLWFLLAFCANACFMSYSSFWWYIYFTRWYSSSDASLLLSTLNFWSPVLWNHQTMFKICSQPSNTSHLCSNQGSSVGPSPTHGLWPGLVSFFFISKCLLYLELMSVLVRAVLTDRFSS